MNVMLLAAGEGLRLRPHTLVLPKPAIPFLNLPLAAYALSFLESAGVNKLVVNTHHLPQQLMNSFKTIPYKSKELEFIHEQDEILGSGGGLRNAQRHFLGEEDFVMMNADEVILPKDTQILRTAFQNHKRLGSIATLLVMDHPGVGDKFGGVWCNDSTVLGFGKEAIPGSDRAWHFVGVQVLSERVFKYIPATGPSNILYDVLKAAIAAGEDVQIHPIRCNWFETGSEKDFLEATSSCLKDLVQETDIGDNLEAIFKKYAQQESRIESSQKFIGMFSPSSVVSEKAVLEGFIVTAENVIVPSSCHLKNVCIGPGVHLPENSKYEDQLILKV